MPFIDQCEICGESTPLRTSKLCGGFYALLCLKHLNGWHKHVSRLKSLTDLLRANAGYDLYMKHGDLEKVLGMGIKAHELRKQLFIEAESWFLGEKGRREAQLMEE